MARAKQVGLGVGALAMINVAAIVSVRNLPVMAEYGWSMLALFAISIIVFLIPIAMVAAELGTGWPRDGGVFAWVKEAFGGRTGFLAVWCDYSENLAWFPTVLSFMAATLAYAINPDLASNSTYLVTVMLVFFWLTTLLNLRGVRASSLLGSLGTIAGSILPAILVVGARHRLPGPRRPLADPLQRPRSGAGSAAVEPGLPRRHHPAVHRHGDGGLPRPRDAQSRTRHPALHRPRRRHHRRVLGARLAVPRDRAAAEADRPRLGHDAAFPQRARHFSRPVAGGDRWRSSSPPAASPTCHRGSSGRPRAWPRWPGRVTRPAALGRENAAGVPVLSLIFQGIGGTIFSLLFLLVPDVSTSYWMLSAVTAQIVIIMYGADVRGRDPTALHPARYAAALPDSGRQVRGVAGRAGSACSAAWCRSSSGSSRRAS